MIDEKILKEFIIWNKQNYNTPMWNLILKNRIKSYIRFKENKFNPLNKCNYCIWYYECTNTEKNIKSCDKLAYMNGEC